MHKLLTVHDEETKAPAAGQFGIAGAPAPELRAYRPAGCPSLEQFEARFLLASDRDDRPRAA